jgi:glycosyltransferase involved in cell wall biosynthesis
MNIGIIVDNEFNDDIRVRKEVNILKRAGNNIFVLCFGFDSKKYPGVEGIHIDRINMKKKYKDFAYGMMNTLPFYELLWRYEVKKFIVRNAIDVLHVHDLYMSRASHLGIKYSGKNCPLIIDLHENYPAAVKSYSWTKGKIRHLLTKPEAWERKEKEYLQYASKIIVLSEAFKDVLLKKYSFLKRDNLTVYPNVIDFQRFAGFPIDKSVQKNDKTTLLYFGAVAARRGIFEVIEAVREVLARGHEVLLLIIGPVDKADKKRFDLAIQNSAIKEHIEYIPWIQLSELPTYLHISDICLAPFLKNPQHESGVANKIFQYMYGHKPIIASDCGPQKKLIEHYKCGLIFSHQVELVDAIIKLVNDEELRNEMGYNGFRALQENYNSELFNKILVDTYKTF